MDPAGLAVGVVGLAALFNNAVDCFKYVQIGRNLGVDFQTSLLKLDMAQLRLSRWGKAVGLADDVQKVRSLHGVLGSEEDAKKAGEVLGHIVELFSRTEQASAKLKGQSGGPRAYDPQTDMDPAVESLHEKMRHLCHGRQNRTSLREKAKWALYKEEHVRKLIAEVTDLVKDLTELFPASKAAQQQICQDDARNILKTVPSDSLAVLSNVAADQDLELEAAISGVTAKLHVSHLLPYPCKGRSSKKVQNLSEFRMKNTWNNSPGVTIGQQISQQSISGGLTFY